MLPRLFKRLCEHAKVPLQRSDLLQNDGELHVGLHPGGHGSGGHAYAVNDGVLEGGATGVQKLLYTGPDLGGDLVSIKVHDVVFDRPLPQELAHRVPRKVAEAHDAEHSLQHVADRVGWHLQGPQLGDVVFFDMAHGLPRGIDLGLDLTQLSLN